jgi:hypothetical protein
MNLHLWLNFSTSDRVFDVTIWLLIGFSSQDWASSVVNSSHSLSIGNLPPTPTQCLSIWSTRWWATSLCLTLPTSLSLRSWLGSLATTTLMAGALQAIIRLGSATWRTHQSGRKVPKTTKSTCKNKKICSGPSKQLETERHQLTDEQAEL